MPGSLRGYAAADKNFSVSAQDMRQTDYTARKAICKRGFTPRAASESPSGRLNGSVNFPCAAQIVKDKWSETYSYDPLSENPSTDFVYQYKKTPAMLWRAHTFGLRGYYSAFVSPGSCPAALSAALSSETLNSVKPAPTKILNHDRAFFISDTCTRSRS